MSCLKQAGWLMKAVCTAVPGSHPVVALIYRKVGAPGLPPRVGPPAIPWPDMTRHGPMRSQCVSSAESEAVLGGGNVHIQRGYANLFAGGFQVRLLAANPEHGGLKNGRRPPPSNTIPKESTWRSSPYTRLRYPSSSKLAANTGQQLLERRAEGLNVAADDQSHLHARARTTL